MGICKRFYGKSAKYKLYVNGRLIKDEHSEGEEIIDEEALISLENDKE